jgi:hypothetical protein
MMCHETSFRIRIFDDLQLVDGNATKKRWFTIVCAYHNNSPIYLKHLLTFGKIVGKIIHPLAWPSLVAGQTDYPRPVGDCPGGAGASA